MFIDKKVPKRKNTMQMFINNDARFCYWKGYEKYYPKTFLKECKYVQENIKLENYISNNLDSDSDDDANDNDKYDE